MDELISKTKDIFYFFWIKIQRPQFKFHFAIITFPLIYNINHTHFSYFDFLTLFALTYLSLLQKILLFGQFIFYNYLVVQFTL